MRIRALAKLNLGLWVGQKRCDGYHSVVTTMVPIQLHDDVSVRLTRSGISVSTNNLSTPTGTANIAHRAAAAFLSAADYRGGCRIRITKRIPIGAGLGGGSSDAAATIRVLNRLLGSPLALPALQKVASSIGSDVPFFLNPRPCVARGRGELLRRVRLPSLKVILCYPGYPILPSWAYAALSRLRQIAPGLTSPQPSPKILCLSLRRGELGRVAKLLHNSFEAVLVRHYPEIARIKKIMLEHGAFAASLSGSGSTVYGLVHERGWQDPMAALKRHGFHPILTQTIATVDDY
ncbi:MAG: 4-(cytidine 5'-diphospho)-2-C-methyl-D-erythritol kinase [candidate division WOR-3 bacterium]